MRSSEWDTTTLMGSFQPEIGYDFIEEAGLQGALLNCSTYKQRTFHFGAGTNVSDSQVYYMADFSEYSNPVSGFPCLHFSALLVKVRTYKLFLLCLNF